MAAVLIAVVAGLSLSPRGPATAASPAELIINRALEDLGTYQGECYIWMQEVVSDALGVGVGNDYRQGYLDAGFVEVSAAEALPGDIIQVNDDADTSGYSEFPGLHTVIILGNLGDGTFNGIDSNQSWDGIVRYHNAYDPAAKAARYPGGAYHIYRFAGTVSPAAHSSVETTPAQATYTVVAGDTLGEIAARLGVSLESLQSANAIDDPDLIRPGDVLTVPGAPPEAEAPASGPATYTVSDGDTLGLVAQRFGVSLDAIMAANGIEDPDLIQLGSVLAIPGEAAPAPADAPAPGAYTVEPGDTLSGIAARFGLDWTGLAAANGIDDPALLQPGQVLTIP
jgi:LysM repeat protein